MKLSLLLIFITGLQALFYMNHWRRSKALKLKNTYTALDIERETWSKTQWRKFKGMFKRKKNKDWKDGEKNLLPNAQEIEEQMQQIDDKFTQIQRDFQARQNKLLIIAPQQLENINLDMVQTTYRPVVYKDGYYSVVFMIGDQYPVDFPYLSIYLLSREKKSKKIGLHIRTLFVDREERKVYSNPEGVDTTGWSSSTSNLLYHSHDDTWIIEWQVPDKFQLASRDDYYFAFYMQRYNPNDSKYVQGLISNRQDGQADIRNLKLIKYSDSYKHLTSSYYHVKQKSSLFPIKDKPVMFSEDWFIEQFGGQDLQLFMGGKMICFQEFQLFYSKTSAHGDKVKISYSTDLLYEYVGTKGSNVAKWFAEVIATSGIFTQSQLTGARKPQPTDNLHNALTFRSVAQARAAAMLYHPSGKATLKQIGKAFLEIAKTYEQSLQPMNYWSRLFSKAWRYLTRTTQIYVGGFRSARRRLIAAVKLLKERFPELPTSEAFESMAHAEQSGITFGFDSEFRKVTVTKIRDRIVRAVRDMMLFEIKLTILDMGNKLMSKQTSWDKIVDGVFKFSQYDTTYYIGIASAIKVYGTKFISMVNAHKGRNDVAFDSMMEQSRLWQEDEEAKAEKLRIEKEETEAKKQVFAMKEKDLSKELALNKFDFKNGYDGEYL